MKDFEYSDCFQSSICRGEFDIEVDLEVLKYAGSGEPDDPPEIQIVSAIVAEDVLGDGGRIVFRKGRKLRLSLVEDEILSDRFCILMY